MPDDHQAATPTAFVATPQGLFTPAGTWFYTTVDDVETYAGAVLDKVSLDDLVVQAEVWLRSPQSLAWVTLLGTLLILPPFVAALLALGAFIGWAMVSPALVNRPLGTLFRWLDHPVVQMLLGVVVLSVLGMAGAYGAVAAGVIGFVLLRWGLVRRFTKPLIDPVHQRLYPLHVTDQVLRACIIRAALAHGVDVPEVDRMAERLTEIMTYKRR